MRCLRVTSSRWLFRTSCYLPFAAYEYAACLCMPIKGCLKQLTHSSVEETSSLRPFMPSLTASSQLEESTDMHTDSTLTLAPSVSSTVSIAAPPASATTSNDRLFGLPAELRENVFALAVREDKHIAIDAPNRIFTPSAQYEFCPIQLPSLALACRQAYAEVPATFHCVNTFHFGLRALVPEDKLATLFDDWLETTVRSNTFVTNFRSIVLSFQWYTTRYPAWVSVYLAIQLDKSGLVHVQTLATPKVYICGLRSTFDTNDLDAHNADTEARRLGGSAVKDSLISHVSHFEAVARASNPRSVFYPSANKCQTCRERMQDRWLRRKGELSELQKQARLWVHYYYGNSSGAGAFDEDESGEEEQG